MTVAERMRAAGWQPNEDGAYDSVVLGLRVTAAECGAFVYAFDGECIFFDRGSDIEDNANLAKAAARKLARQRRA